MLKKKKRNRTKIINPMEEKIKSQKGFIEIIILIIIILGAIFIFKIFDFGFLTTEISAYPIMCKEKVNYGICEDPDFPLNINTYKVSAEKQEVIHWVEGVGSPSRLTKCAVRDRKNWSCKYNDESAEFGFTDGMYWEHSLISSSTDEPWEKVYYVPRLIWAKISCTSNGNLSISCFIFSIILD